MLRRTTLALRRTQPLSMWTRAAPARPTSMTSRAAALGNTIAVVASGQTRRQGWQARTMQTSSAQRTSPARAAPPVPGLHAPARPHLPWSMSQAGTRAPNTTAPHFSTTSTPAAKATTASSIPKRAASAGNPNAPKRREGPPTDPKLLALAQTTRDKRAPPPLTMSRARRLRHWTIHRAWQLFVRNERAARERELLRLQQSMERACEALRGVVGPLEQPQDGGSSSSGGGGGGGGGSEGGVESTAAPGFFGNGPAEGYLFRVAMEKKGLYGVAVPRPGGAASGAAAREAAAARKLKGVPIEYARPQTDTPARIAWDHDWKRS